MDNETGNMPTMAKVWRGIDAPVLFTNRVQLCAAYICVTTSAKKVM